ncbi:hypothetical protein ACFYZ9_21720 [Streptomyces sp. NPDC001691]|uniref:hypothetical protein n=1 Tax=Streptomyces sp. NPDC001691 TaxID=3364600 RepID=UPI0036CAA2EF
MRTYRLAGLGCLLLLTALGCGGAGGGSATEGKLTTASASAPGPAATFLPTGGCASREGAAGDTKDFHEVPCTSERAVARVLVRRVGATAKGAAVDCPLPTDFVLYVASAGGGGAPGYACMRNLEPPHPGDPGQGGGPYTVVGDCVYAAGVDEVRETACDGSGARAPQYRVVSAAPSRAGCPASTALYVQLTGGQGPVGCARRT